MTDIPTVTLWMGMDIETLDRKMLIEAVHYLVRVIESERRATRKIIEMNDAFDRARNISIRDR